jgi:hypothetical protein
MHTYAYFEERISTISSKRYQKRNPIMNIHADELAVQLHSNNAVSVKKDAFYIMPLSKILA